MLMRPTAVKALADVVLILITEKRLCLYGSAA